MQRPGKRRSGFDRRSPFAPAVMRQERMSNLISLFSWKTDCQSCEIEFLPAPNNMPDIFLERRAGNFPVGLNDVLMNLAVVMKDGGDQSQVFLLIPDSEVHGETCDFEGMF